MEKENFGLRFVRGFTKGLLYFLLIFAIVLCVNAIANAHGYAEWFNQSHYVALDGKTHCCGPTDCKHLDEWHATVHEDESGFLVRIEKHTETLYDESGGTYDSIFDATEQYFSKKDDYKSGLYFTEDENNEYVVCVIGGKIKCLAVPRKAMN